jgi:enoyl-CoA hydratase
MSTELVQFELTNGVAIVRVDDGKANAISPALIAQINGALDRAESEARAVLLVGRPGRFSGGFDLRVMQAAPEGVQSLVSNGAELAMRLFGFPRPVVIACTGHAIAMGAVLLLCGDVRVGADGDFKIGLNEVTNGMTLPVFAVELARERLSRRHLGRATLTAELYAPAGAVDAGFLDRITSPGQVVDEAITEATRLAAAIDPRSFARTKRRLRSALIAQVRETVADDMRRLAAGE